MVGVRRCSGQIDNNFAENDDENGEFVQFRLRSRYAHRVQLVVFAADGVTTLFQRLLLRDEADAERWSLTLPYADEVWCYGFRVWGPNWLFDPAWTPGSELGFICDCDDNGHRFNPNKLLLDPYAIEIAGEPPRRLSAIDPDEPVADFYSGHEHRAIDTAPLAAKGVVHPSLLDDSDFAQANAAQVSSFSICRGVRPSRSGRWRLRLCMKSTSVGSRKTTAVCRQRCAAPTPG